MKYHSSLLNQYIDIQDTPENIANQLTCKICEIEETIMRTIPEKVVIGKVMDAEKHPDADKLFVCHIDCGKAGVFQICTGGENVQAGIYVPVAIPWCYLPVPKLQIDPRKMRWLDSNGMICSKTELGINEDAEHHWIWDLTKDFTDLSDKDAGTPLSVKYPFLESCIWDVENKTITHRPDLTGHFGIATELYAMYEDDKITKKDIVKIMDKVLDTDIVDFLEDSKASVKKISPKTDKLRSYVLAEISDIEVKSSSFMTRLILRDLGHTPKNNWVDFSNIFMYLTGQPVHFFDADTIVGDVIIRMAKDAEEFIDLTWATHSLQATDIVIADSKKILALAGIIGGQSSAISEDTKHLVVEIANFDPVVVRKTGTRLGLRTDAELRFEKNINPAYTLHTYRFLVDFLKIYATELGKYTLWWLACYAGPEATVLAGEKKIDISIEDLQALLGEDIDAKAMAKKFLPRLGFDLSKHDVVVPVRRWPADMNLAADVYEEVCRLVWYDAIRLYPLHHRAEVAKMPRDVQLKRFIEDIAKDTFHADQVETYPWVPEKYLHLFGTKLDGLYSVNNALDPEAKYLRDDMVYNLLSVIAKNARFFDTLDVFDIGKVWDQSFAKNSGVYASDFVGESTSFGYMAYRSNVKSWRDDSILIVKAVLSHIIKGTDLDESKIELLPSSLPSYHPKKQARVQYDGMLIWFVGTIHPLITDAYKIPEKGQVSYMDINLSNLENAMPSQKYYSNRFATLQDQLLTRDISLVVPHTMPLGTVINAIQAVPTISSVDVFDLYAGENIGADKKSMACTISIKGDGSMTTEHINAVIQEAVKAAEGVGAKLRE